MNELYFVNIFRDREGLLHYSTEEFSLSQDRLSHFGDAVDDAYLLTKEGGWHYLCTLTNNDAITVEIRKSLNQLEHLRFLHGAE